MAVADSAVRSSSAAGKTAAPTTVDALIIGAGFSGMYQLHLLRDQLGMSVQVLEAGGGVGGTWYWNRYPGARCDSESHSYCYTFSDDLIRDWEWSERYPEQPEIMRYLNHVADRFDLRRNIKLDTRVASAHYDDNSNRWLVTTQGGDQWKTKFLITAVGCLSTANVPKIPGLETFAGKWFHTGEWPHDGVDFTGKRVGLIGTGSTGIQAAPVIAAQAKHLTVFQRTANYSVPAHNAPLTPAFRAWVKENMGDIKKVMRSTTNGHPFVIEERLVGDVTPEERLALYEAAWKKGGLQFRATFKDLLVNKAANDTAAEFLKNKIRSIVRDKPTAELLADIDHPYAAKRPPIDSDYFDTFNRNNVTLVDVRSHPIEIVTPSGLKTAEANYSLDIIVFATGFDAMTGPLLRIDICGRGGVRLAKAWEAGPRSYLGLQVAGFPNLFTITGPGSPSVLCNMPVAIEQHVEWIADCIGYMRSNGFERIEAKPAAVDNWVEEVNAAANCLRCCRRRITPGILAPTFLASRACFMPYPGGMAKYRGICDSVAAEGYEGFELAS